MNDIGGKERRFLDALESLFTGAQVDGQSGFINLMRIKRRYFQSLRPQLLQAIDSRARPQTAAREELFDKLYTFFGRYFCESGSIYFRHLPAFAQTYQQVYADGQDVALSWKTQDLYYVKSDTLIRSMPITLEHPARPDKNLRFYFDASQLQHKQNNEKRELLFQFQQTQPSADGPVLHLEVHYSQKGRKTNMESILKQARQAQPCIRLSEEQLQKACRIFRRQTEADFFIHKDARAFLREQFDLWMYQYLFWQETIFQEKRIQQLQAIQQTAYDIIDLIAQFEDELRRIWEKPKFVRRVNYVITLDKLPATLLKKLAQQQGAVNQLQEWKELGMVEETFHFEDVLKPNSQHKHLPLDTKHFPSMKLEILATLGNLDEVLDGELVHSENWQALNTLSKRYKEKVKTIYIDPPYNTGSDGFMYGDTYRHSSWLSMIENRLSVAQKMQTENGSAYVSINENELFNLKQLLDRIYGQDNYLTALAVKVRHENRILRGDKDFHEVFEMALAYRRTNKHIPKKREVDNTSVDQYVWQVNAGSPAEKHIFGGKEVEVFPPENYELIKLPPSDNLLKRISVRGSLREGNSSGRFYVAHLEPLAKRYQNHLFRVSNIGNDHLGFRYFWLPAESGNRKNGDYFQGIPQNREDTKLEPYANLLDFEKAFNQCASEGGVTFRNGRKPVAFLEHILLLAGVVDENKSIILDFFAGSGTTGHAVINLNREDGGNRKYVLVEMGDYFHTVLLPRIKKVVYSKDWKDSKPVSREGVSHCFKYYTLEQYEETLRNVHYRQDSEQLEIDSAKSPFEQYVFFGDDKLAHACQFAKDDAIEINLQGLYPDVDVAETLSNLLGKAIRCLDENQVTFADGTTEKINPKTMTEKEKLHFLSILKPALWWGEL